MSTITPSPTYVAIADVARDASMRLNNAAIRAPEPVWGEVQRICRELDALAKSVRGF